MNNPTSAKKSSTPSKSDRAESARKRIKTPVEDRVEAQLARREASGEAENGINYDGTSLETTGKVVLWGESSPHGETADALIADLERMLADAKHSRDDIFDVPPDRE